MAYPICGITTVDYENEPPVIVARLKFNLATGGMLR